MVLVVTPLKVSVNVPAVGVPVKASVWAAFVLVVVLVTDDRVPLPLMYNVPPLTVVVPVNVLAAVNVSVPLALIRATGLLPLLAPLPA